MSAVGFTGTREGMTEPQRIMVSALLQSLGATEFHHGDCEGADSEAHDLAFHDLGIYTIVHPPDNDRLRAYRAGRDSASVREPKPYLARNEDIVREAEVLIAAPKEAEEQPTGGTWWTVRKALELGRTVYVVPPSGLPERRDPDDDVEAQS